MVSTTDARLPAGLVRGWDCIELWVGMSSYGELDAFRCATVRPLDFVAMAHVDYDITRYQPVLFSGRSTTHVYDALEEFLTSFDDEAAVRLVAGDRLGQIGDSHV